GTVDAGPARRPAPGGVRHDACVGAARALGKAACARDFDRGAAAGFPGDPDRRGGGSRRLSGHDLVWRVRSGRHAVRDRQSAACGLGEGDADARSEGEAGRHRRRRHDLALAGGIRRAGARRHRALREDRQGHRPQDRLMKIIPSGAVLGASIEGIDLTRPFSAAEDKEVVAALGKYSVLRFPKQKLDGAQLKRFSAGFGELEVNVASGPYQEPGHPEVMILSNIVENGRPLGIADAGQDWHTDMSYSRTIAFANVLYGIKIPRRNGQPLGNTEFCSMHAAYEGLPANLKTKLEGMTVLHDFSKF